MTFPKIWLRVGWATFLWIALIHVSLVLGPLTYTWQAALVALGLFVVTGLGITMGYHRLFTHASYAVPKPLYYLLAVIGGLAGEGDVITWVALHRKHHRFSDQEGDPHSPVLDGLPYAHVLWLFRRKTRLEHRELVRTYAPDLYKDRWLRFISRMFLPSHGIVALALVAAGWWLGGWEMAASFFVWGMGVRMLLVLHVTWCVNSVTHWWGYKNYDTQDSSRNNLLIGLLAAGEGWHNNHHAKPVAANHGQRWFEFDLTHWIIRAMALIGLAWNVKVFDRLKGKMIILYRRPNRIGA